MMVLVESDLKMEMGKMEKAIGGGVEREQVVRVTFVVGWAVDEGVWEEESIVNGDVKGGADGDFLC